MTEQLKVIISAEIGKLKQNVDAAKQKIKEFANDKEKIKEFSEEFSKVGDVSKKALATMGTAIIGASAALFALASAGKEHTETQALLSSAFETAGGSADTAKTVYNDLFRVLGDSGQATEAAQHLAKLTTEEQALSEWTTICQGVYATFGASLPIESLTEAVNHSAKLGEVQGALADALEWSGVNVEDFNAKLFECNTEAEREALIREVLGGLYNDAAANYEKTGANILAQNEAQAEMNATLAELNEALAPVMTELQIFGTEILAALAPQLKEFTEKYGKDIIDILGKIADAIGKVLSWVIDNWDLVSDIAIVIAAICTALSIFSTVMGIVNMVMLASPVTPVVIGITAAIGALIAIIVVIIKYWDNIKGAGKAAVDGIKKAWDGIANWFNNKVVQPIVNFFTGLWNKIKNIGSSIKDFFKNLFNFKWSLPKLKLPKFSVTPAGWEIGDLLKGVIPKLSIAWNARGGVFDKPTLFGYGDTLQGIGENGAEAVVPLENNLEWLNKLADMLSRKMGAGTPIVLQVDGKTFAKTAINSINDLTKQQGKLALNIM